MTAEERTRAAIRFEHPDRVPIWFFNRDQLEGDILAYGFSLPDGDRNEWGYRFENLDDGTMGQVKVPVLPTWDALDGFISPSLRKQRRVAGVGEFLKTAGDRYRVASLGITGFNVYTFLRGFENAMVDFATERDKACDLLDRIVDFETQLIDLAAECGFHGVHLADDWGTQKGLIVHPSLWREIFKPRYRRQCERAHQLGLDVWFHSCGNVLSIVPEFHEIGVDVLNISQPNAVDTTAVGRKLRGKQCFLIPISYQTISIAGTTEDIHAEARRLYGQLGHPGGGFIGYVEEYGCMGMSEENYQACGEAFRLLSRG